MKQLALTLAPRPAPALDNFYPGRNHELVSALRTLVADNSIGQFVYLWGEPDSGRSHLLQAVTSALATHGVPAVYVAAGEAVPVAVPGLQAVAVDDVEALDAPSQVAFFNLYNCLREHHGIVLAAGCAPPSRLQLRADLVTRLGWGLVYQVHALSDEEKIAALKRHAVDRAFNLPDGVAEYLLRHLRRDLSTLLAMLDLLDRYSLEAKRPITVPLLRELLQMEGAMAQNAGGGG